MTFDTVIFDMDGTLLNTLDDLADACNHALRELGFPEHPKAAYRKFVGNGAKLLCWRALPETNRDDDTMRRARAGFDEYYAVHLFDRTAPYPGISELLRALAARGLRLGVLSNKPDEFVRRIAERYFPGVFGAVSGPREGRVKPDPGGLRHLLAQLDAPPDRCLYVGDSGVDMETARNAGAQSCGVLWGFRDADELRAAGAGHLASTPAEILTLVDA